MRNGWSISGNRTTRRSSSSCGALQLAYRDAGRAEEAAAIAANVRALQQRVPPVSTTLTADLVNDGLPGRDEPVRMALFRDHVGETLSFSVRGRDDQPIWGTTVYTDDSALETAAVHAGLLRPGQRGIVKVRVLAGQDHYDGTKQHDIESAAFGRHAGSFRFMDVSSSRPNRTNQLASYRDLVGQSIVLPVVGSASGEVWGSDVYTDDSSVGAAAVHAGLVGVGDLAFVKVTLLPGQARYESTSRYGVRVRPTSSGTAASGSSRRRRRGRCNCPAARTRHVWYS